MENVVFKTVSLNDALRISILLKTVYIQVYGLEGVSFEFANFIDNRFSEAKIAKIISENPNQIFAAYYKENPVGVAEVLVDSICPIRKIEVAELGKLYVLERFYGMGIGFGLLNSVEKRLKLEGYNELNLEVYMNNKRAISFYERQGYRTLGEVDFPMEENTYRNLVMNKVFP